MKNKWQDKQEFKKEVMKIADKLDLKIGTIYIMPMSSKWASITSDARRLYFDEKILQLEKSLGRYVIYHELLHLRVPNHGKLFKAMLRNYLGNYSKLEERLQMTA